MTLKKFILTCAVAVLAAAPAAWADNLDFTCSLGNSEHCSGTIIPSGSNYRTTGINVFDDSGPYSSSVPFHLIFNTATGAIQLDGTGKYAGQDLVGDLDSFNVFKGKTTTDIQFSADWPTLPSAAQGFLGSSTGLDSGFVIALTTHGTVQSVDLVITPTPEPTPLLLLGSGLLGIGGFLRRKLHLM